MFVINFLSRLQKEWYVDFPAFQEFIFLLGVIWEAARPKLWPEFLDKYRWFSCGQL